MGDKPVYSTATGRGKKEKVKKSDGYRPSDGPAKMRLETKGRGGKAVTVLFELPLTETDAKRLMKDMQTLLGIGATFKNGSIELRGDVRDKVEQVFQDRGLKIKRAGG